MRIVAVVLAVSAFGSPARGWSDRGHSLITEEAVERLPEPLRGLFLDPGDLERLRKASASPDGWRKVTSPHYSPDEKPRHFLNIDAITKEAYPFASFPRERAAAEKEFGAGVFKEQGSAPWAADEALARLASALTAGRTADIFREAGAMAHYTADLHMPFHVTKNYDGQLTGNLGIHKALEVGLIHRHLDWYADKVRRNRQPPPFVHNVPNSLFAWLVEAHGRIKPILDADTAARAKAKYDPSRFSEDLDDLGSERAAPYYTALKQELEVRGSLEAVALREAAGHVAELLYTAWVRAGKPLALKPAPASPKEAPAAPTWIIIPAIAMLVLLLWPRRRPQK